MPLLRTCLHTNSQADCEVQREYLNRFVQPHFSTMAVTTVQPFWNALLSGFVVIQPHWSLFKHELLLSQQFTVHLYHRPVTWSSCASALDHKTIWNSPLIFSAWEQILLFHQPFNGLERAGHPRTRTLNTKRVFFFWRWQMWQALVSITGLKFPGLFFFLSSAES